MSNDDHRRGWAGPETEFARIVAAAWHEFRYPRPALDEPSGSFERAIRAALDESAAPSPAVDRDALAALFRAAPGRERLGDQTPGEIADALLARYDIRERGETQSEPDGAAQIVAERRRVVTAKGYDAAHDDQHTAGELAAAAICYAADPNHIGVMDDLWPWTEGEWKPTPGDRVKELVKAGQFIAAEIDRLQRAKRGDLS